MKYGSEIIKVKKPSLEDFSVEVTFDDGKTGRVRLDHIFGKPKNKSAEVLRGGVFDRCFVQSGALAWPNGFELCPDAVYDWLVTQADNDVAQQYGIKPGI